MIEPTYLTESEPKVLDLTPEEAAAIGALGKTLASKTEWWGGDAAVAAGSERSILSCVPSAPGKWQVTVRDAIGAFGTDEFTAVVLPKFSTRHVLYIMACGSTLPRLSTAPIAISEGADFLELIAIWFLEQTRAVIARDLIRDYQNVFDICNSARGQIDAQPTAELYYSGSLGFACSFDEFTIDNDYNRLLLAALLTLQRLPGLRSSLRADSRRLASYFAEVGPLRGTDHKVVTDRRTAHYQDALTLAALILSGMSLSLSSGKKKAWTFLVRTPDVIEDGLREILRAGLAPQTDVRKYGTTLDPKSMRVQPDLRFDPYGLVGDVKYKAYGAEWDRGDLYQSVAFAKGCGAKRSCVISFRKKQSNELPRVSFDDIQVSSFVWDAHGDIEPELAARQLVNQCKDWLNEPGLHRLSDT